MSVGDDGDDDDPSSSHHHNPASSSSVPDHQPPDTDADDAASSASSSQAPGWAPRQPGHRTTPLDIDFLDMHAQPAVLLAMGVGDVLLSNQQQKLRMPKEFKRNYFHLAGPVFMHNEWRAPLAETLRNHHDVQVHPPPADGGRVFCIKGSFVSWHLLYQAVRHTLAANVAPPPQQQQQQQQPPLERSVRIVMRGTKMDTNHFVQHLLPHAMPERPIVADFGRRVHILFGPNGVDDDDEHHHGDQGPFVTLVHANLAMVHVQRFKTQRYALFGALAKLHHGGLQLCTRKTRAPATRFCPHGRITKITIYSKHEHVLRACSGQLGMTDVPTSVTMLRRKRATFDDLLRRLEGYDGRHVQGLRFEARIEFDPPNIGAVLRYMDHMLRPSGVDTVAAVPPELRAQPLRRAARRAVRGDDQEEEEEQSSSSFFISDDDAVDDGSAWSSSSEADDADDGDDTSSDHDGGAVADDGVVAHGAHRRVLHFQRIPLRLIHQQLRFFLKLAETRACLYRGDNNRKPSYGQRAQYTDLMAMFGHVLHKYEKWAGSVLTWTDRANALHWTDVCGKDNKMLRDASVHVLYRRSVLAAIAAHQAGAQPVLLQPVVLRLRPGDRARYLLDLAVRRQVEETRKFQAAQQQKRRGAAAAAAASDHGSDQSSEDDDVQQRVPAMPPPDVMMALGDVDDPRDPKQPPVHVLAEAIEDGDRWIADILVSCVIMVRKGQVGLRRRRHGAFLWADGWGDIADKLRERQHKLMHPRKGHRSWNLKDEAVWRRLLAVRQHAPPPDDDSEGGDEEE